MTIVSLLRKWLIATPIIGKAALVVSVLAVGIPTIIRASLVGTVAGAEFLPYFPFVLVAAMLLEWKPAVIVMLVSALLADWLFVEPQYRLLAKPSHFIGVVIFVAGSSLVIALVHAIRTALDDLVGPTSNNGVIFSLREEQVWASWPTAGFHLRLGPQDEVADMMNDFLAQLELGKRLAAASQAKALGKMIRRPT
jgi:hypothetical protein